MKAWQWSGSGQSPTISHRNRCAISQGEPCRVPPSAVCHRLFETIRADASREENGVAIVFKGEPRFFVGTVKVDGAKGAT